MERIYEEEIVNNKDIITRNIMSFIFDLMIQRQMELATIYQLGQIHFQVKIINIQDYPPL